MHENASMPQTTQSFTVDYSERVNAITTEVLVSSAFGPSQAKVPSIIEQFNAIWDTEATNSVISKHVVDKCGLKPIGMAEVHTAGGTRTSEVFLVNIFLPNKVIMQNVRATQGNLSSISGIDVLVGMDIIGRGDFAVTNMDGKTTFSFRVPSISRIDFTEEDRIRESQSKKSPPKIGRNQPCPCGSGKKYKHCCGK